jgi:signal transduction histidine kinase
MAETEGGLTRRVIAASALLALIIGGAFALLLFALGELHGAEGRTAHAQDVLVAANQLERLVLDLETGQRGFVLTKQERFLEPWTTAQAAFPREAAALLALVAGEANPEAEARTIAQQERSYITDYSVPLVNAARRGDPSASSVAATEAGKERVDVMREHFDRLITDERLIDGRGEATADSETRRASVGAAIALAGSIALIALYAGYVARAIVRPVRRAALMAGRLASGDLTARLPETGAGEIGALERAFNVMGGSLERGRDELAGLASEQAALRRVATLVARAAPPPAVFAAVAEEVGRLIQVERAFVIRYDADETVTVVGASSTGEDAPPIGTRYTPGPRSVTALVRETGRAARIDAAEDSAPFSAHGIASLVAAPITVEGRMWGVVGVASADEDQPPAQATEQRLTGFTELVATAIANAEAQAALTSSRARIVVTADETRRRIERDLHDGAQQRLVSLALQLRAAQASVPPESEDLRRDLDRMATGLINALDELRELARGIHPAALAEGGLALALKTLARRVPVPVELDVHIPDGLPERIEVGVYYVVSEALANAAKHAQASRVWIEATAQDGVLRVLVRDNGRGGAAAARGTGLVGLRDRVEALGGRISFESPPGAGTSVRVELPIADAR